MNTCEHELTISDERWISDEEVEITAKCYICQSKFIGKLKCLK